MLKRFRILGIGFLTVLVLLAAFIPASQAQAQVTCYGAVPSRLQVGAQGRISPGLPNVFRSRPYRGYDSIVIGQIPAGTTVTLVGGPSCFDSMLWWQINWNGTIGWTPEASNTGEYWIDPASVNNDCMNIASRLSSGNYARVLPGLPNVLRSQPNRRAGSMILANLPAGMVFSVVGQPSCAEGMIWWQVNTFGQSGWTPEGQYSTYWLEPYGQTAPPAPIPCLLTRFPHMQVGYSGIVAPRIPNNLRAQASQYGQILASMAAGESFTVLSGPVCADNLVWWQVNYRGKVGWTVEGQNGSFWIDPLACPGFQSSRISVGKYARVTPGLPNRLRSTPSTRSLSLALIPVGSAFSVIGGAVCAENTIWWQVNYQGIIGWTMEGQGNQYWLELTS